jgi:hypothetical protein
VVALSVVALNVVALSVVTVATPVTTAPFVNVGAAPLRPVIELAVILDISNLLWF